MKYTLMGLIIISLIGLPSLVYAMDTELDVLLRIEDILENETNQIIDKLDAIVGNEIENGRLDDIYNKLQLYIGDDDNRGTYYIENVDYTERLNNIERYLDYIGYYIIGIGIMVISAISALMIFYQLSGRGPL